MKGARFHTSILHASAYCCQRSRGTCTSSRSGLKQHVLCHLLQGYPSVGDVHSTVTVDRSKWFEYGGERSGRFQVRVQWQPPQTYSRSLSDSIGFKRLLQATSALVAGSCWHPHLTIHTMLVVVITAQCKDFDLHVCSHNGNADRAKANIPQQVGVSCMMMSMRSTSPGVNHGSWHAGLQGPAAVLAGADQP